MSTKRLNNFYAYLSKFFFLFGSLSSGFSSLFGYWFGVYLGLLFGFGFLSLKNNLLGKFWFDKLVIKDDEILNRLGFCWALIYFSKTLLSFNPTTGDDLLTEKAKICWLCKDLAFLHWLKFTIGVKFDKWRILLVIILNVLNRFL